MADQYPTISAPKHRIPPSFLPNPNHHSASYRSDSHRFSSAVLPHHHHHRNRRSCPFDRQFVSPHQIFPRKDHWILIDRWLSTRRSQERAWIYIYIYIYMGRKMGIGMRIGNSYKQSYHQVLRAQCFPPPRSIYTTVSAVDPIPTRSILCVCRMWLNSDAK